jgi:uncharacterized membrane protein
MIEAVPRWADGERGQVLVLVALLLVGLVAVAGLVTDGGVVFTQRRDLQNIADGAALAGAMQVDENAYRSSGGANVVLDQGAAYQAAVEYLQGEGDSNYSVRASTTGVDVQVSRRAATAFLRIIGIDGVTISAHARAEPQHGIAATSP